MRRVLIAAVALSLCAPGAARANDRQQILALYENLRQAMLHKDAAAITKMETPDFRSSSHGQVLNGAQMEAGMKQQFAMQGAVKSLRIKVLQLNIQGKSATGVSAYKFAGYLNAPGAANAHPHMMTMDGQVHNALKKTASGWKFQSMDSGPTKMTMDGKPITPPTGGPGN